MTGTATAACTSKVCESNVRKNWATTSVHPLHEPTFSTPINEALTLIARALDIPPKQGVAGDLNIDILTDKNN